MAYGYNYCNGFQANRKFFSPWGKQWVSATCLCLQQQLKTAIANGTINATTPCDDIKNYAWASHLGCYTDTSPSICDIPLTDWSIVLITVRDSLNDPMTYGMMYEVGAACGTAYLNLVVSILGL